MPGLDREKKLQREVESAKKGLEMAKEMGGDIKKAQERLDAAVAEIEKEFGSDPLEPKTLDKVRSEKAEEEKKGMLEAEAGSTKKGHSLTERRARLGLSNEDMRGLREGASDEYGKSFESVAEREAKIRDELEERAEFFNEAVRSLENLSDDLKEEVIRRANKEGLVPIPIDRGDIKTRVESLITAVDSTSISDVEKVYNRDGKMRTSDKRKDFADLVRQVIDSHGLSAEDYLANK